jgi:uncharacterized delta-60 repeat protein
MNRTTARRFDGYVRVSLSTALALLVLCSSQALAGVQSDPAGRRGTIPPAAVLDPSFGGGGLVTLPGELPSGWTAYGAATPNGDVFVSGGPTLRLLTSSGDPAASFGDAGTLSPPPPEGGEFSLGDFTLDSEGRLLVVGTSRFPGDEDGLPGNVDDGPYGPNGAPLPIEPSAVRILRFLPDGRPDPSFGQSGVIETDFGLPPPKACGSGRTSSGQPTWSSCRGDKGGRAIQSEASMGFTTSIAVDPQRRIVVTGSADITLGESCGHDIFEPLPVSAAFFARLTENGALDPSFGGDGLVGGRRLGENPLRAESVEPVLGPRGEITYRSTDIGACFENRRGRWGVAQLTPDGRTRKSLGRKGAVGGRFTALAGAPDGSVVALAPVGRYQGEPFRARLIRIGPDGEVDRSFGHRGRTLVKLGMPLGIETDSLAVDAQGRILMGGTLATSKRKRAPNGKLVRRGRRSILLVRLSAGGRQEMGFGPNGRVATPFPGLFPPSDLFFDPDGRVVTVHRYVHRDKAGEVSGLVLARYLLRN